MPWIKYNENDSATYPKKNGEYRIQREGGEFVVAFRVGWGWQFLIFMPDFWWSEDEIVRGGVSDR
jgi:hypothetical protein